MEVKQGYFPPGVRVA